MSEPADTSVRSALLDLASPESQRPPVSLYVHVPFCRVKCAYCDFHSAPGTPELHAALVDALIAEAARWHASGALSHVDTVYIGGGTPTALAEELPRLVSALAALAPLAREFTVEANPDSLAPELLDATLAAGADRISLGVQSFDAGSLRLLGRCHDADQARAAASLLRDRGVRFSVDLICGIPGESTAQWAASVREAVATGAGHVSVYPLAVEEGTPLARAIEAGRIAEPDPDLAAEQMLVAQQLLAESGFRRYEVANHALPGQESRHNTGYWTGRPYVGVGPSAASMLPADVYRASLAMGSTGWPVAAPAAARVRFTRAADTTAYLADPLAPPADIEALTPEEAAREDLMLGMRLARGVSAADVVAAGLREQFASLAADGLVVREDADGEVRWRCTERGWLLGNVVFGRIWNAE